MADRAVSLTSVPLPATRRIARRKRVYLALQVGRVVLFVAALVLPLPLWVRASFLLVAGAASLVAVTAATSPDRPPTSPAPMPPYQPGRELPRGHS